MELLLKIQIKLQVVRDDTFRFGPVIASRPERVVSTPIEFNALLGSTFRETNASHNTT